MVKKLEEYWLVLAKYYLKFAALVTYSLNQSKPILTISTETTINQS